MSEAAETARWVAFAAASAHLLIVAAVATRVLMTRRPPGASAAWLLLLIVLPYGGALLYLLFGERPLGRRRINRVLVLRERTEEWLHGLAQRTPARSTGLIERWSRIRRLADGAVGIAALPANRLTLLDETEGILRTIIADIECAEHFCLLEFYIWNPGGTADEVAEALMRAARRGISCRVLLDDVGSVDFFRSTWPKRMRAAGIEIHQALPAGVWRAAFRRIDLRMHRKIAVVDSRVAYTGSLNLVDPRFFKQAAGVGQWVDAMARIEGPAVEMLAALFAWDWAVETGTSLDALLEQIDRPLDGDADGAAVQIVPSGPGYTGNAGNAIVQLLLTAVYGARHELILTTPYFVPDEALVAALQAAARRGVRVRLILPAKVDSLLVRYASRAFYDDLLEAGVEILLFDAGLLHTKSVVIDREVAFFGTLNLDMRSFLLNFEVTLIVYDRVFSAELATLATRYAEASERLELAVWQQRPPVQRLTENLLQLMSPLL